jgi:hypothetical protein
LRISPLNFKFQPRISLKKLIKWRLMMNARPRPDFTINVLILATTSGSENEGEREKGERGKERKKE